MEALQNRRDFCQALKITQQRENCNGYFLSLFGRCGTIRSFVTNGCRDCHFLSLFKAAQERNVTKCIPSLRV